MSISVVVMSEQGERINNGLIPYQRIVGWDNRRAFPMLGYTDTMGNLILNQLQVRDLLEEIATIERMVELDGPAAAAEQLGTPDVSDDFKVANWEVESGLLSTLAQLRQASLLTLERPHRYLWFVGD
jgi:hypothetical protein